MRKQDKLTAEDLGFPSKVFLLLLKDRRFHHLTRLVEQFPSSVS